MKMSGLDCADVHVVFTFSSRKTKADYKPVQGGSSVVVLCCNFLKSVSLTFHLMYVKIMLSSVKFAE